MGIDRGGTSGLVWNPLILGWSVLFVTVVDNSFWPRPGVDTGGASVQHDERRTSGFPTMGQSCALTPLSFPFRRLSFYPQEVVMVGGEGRGAGGGAAGGATAAAASSSAVAASSGMGSCWL